MRPTRKVVCIEDDIEIQDIETIILNDTPGVETISAFNGYDGLEAVQNHKPDLVLLDLLLPGMNGWDVYARIRADENLRHTPVIVVSCCPRQVANALHDNLTGIQGYVSKPFSVADLRAAVDRVLEPM